VALGLSSSSETVRLCHNWNNTTCHFDTRNSWSPLKPSMVTHMTCIPLHHHLRSFQGCMESDEQYSQDKRTLGGKTHCNSRQTKQMSLHMFPPCTWISTRCGSSSPCWMWIYKCDGDVLTKSNSDESSEIAWLYIEIKFMTLTDRLLGLFVASQALLLSRTDWVCSNPDQHRAVRLNLVGNILPPHRTQPASPL